MPRIAGVDIPPKKKVLYSLQYIYGIGPVVAKRILKETNISENMRASELTEGEVTKIRSVIDANHKVEGDLRRDISGSIKMLKDIQCFRGQRHIKKLPARGQRSRTNARTAKGRKRIAIAGKKKAPNAK